LLDTGFRRYDGSDVVAEAALHDVAVEAAVEVEAFEDELHR
jgi:hypothetical protein